MTSAPIVVTAAALGTVVASYVTTAAMRATSETAPEGARSLCDHCRRQLGWRESFPLVSFVMLRGRCKTCGAPISRLHPMGEAAGLLAGGAIALVAPDSRAVALAIMAATLLAASVIDARIRILPDLMVVVTGLTGTILAFTYSLDAGLEGLGMAALLLVVFGGFALGFERLRGSVGFGLGDVKLLAALALWLGMAAPWAVVIAMVLAIVRVMISPPADRRVTTGPLLAAAGFSIGLLLEVGIWPRL